MLSTMRPMNSGNSGPTINLSIIKKCLLLGGNLTKTVTFGRKRFVCYSRHVHYLGCPLLGSFTSVFHSLLVRTNATRLLNFMASATTMEFVQTNKALK